MGWEEDTFVTWLDGTLFDTASEDITDTLDLVDTRKWDTHGTIVGTLWWDDEVFEALEDGLDVDLVTLGVDDVNTLPPFHVVLAVGTLTLNEVVSLPS